MSIFSRPRVLHAEIETDPGADSRSAITELRRMVQAEQSARWRSIRACSVASNCRAANPRISTSGGHDDNMGRIPLLYCRRQIGEGGIRTPGTV